MNKKIVIMLTAVLCVVSVILVSLFGQVPNFQTNVLVREITIEGYLDKEGNLLPCETNTKGENFIVLDNIEAGETSVILKWKVGPDNATDPDVSFKLSVEDGSVVVSSQGIVTFYSADVRKVAVYILPKDGGPASAKVTIMKKADEEEEIVAPGVLPVLPI